MTQDKMQEEVLLLAKRGNGDWQYREKNGESVLLGSVMQILHSTDSSIINWGNHVFFNDGYFKMNRPSGIAMASDKRSSRLFLQQKGVKVPRTYAYGDNFDFSHGPIVARPSQHHGGQNFNIINDGNDFLRLSKLHDLTYWYFAEIFPKTTEFRVHVGHGKALFVQEKPLVEGEIRANQAVNHESWTVVRWSNQISAVNVEAIKAVELLGLDYGAADVMYNASDDSVAICEVNTSPSINTPYSSQKYADYFDWCIRHDFPEHMPLEDDKNIFYSEMLRD
jgi:glutathione synthase/RimK-type ligase-like ATP-grasp enzyme